MYYRTRKRKTMEKMKGGTKTIHKKSAVIEEAPYDDQILELKPKPTEFQKKFLKIANTAATTKTEFLEIQRSFRNKGLKQSEQSWADTNFNTIVDLMGEKVIWQFMVPDIDGRGWEETRASSRKIPTSSNPVAVFSGAHWTSRKAGESVFFDPYYEYQIPGTNQFCQTFALMYLMDKLPEPIVSQPGDISKYYYYTRAAIEFIIEVFEIFPFVGETREQQKYNRDYYLNRAKNCLKNSNACLNIIEMPERWKCK